MHPPTTVTPLSDPDWDQISAFFPDDLAASAFQYGALVRKRPADGLPDAETLLRFLLAYSCDQSLRSTAAWGAAAHLATISAPALRARVRQSGAWLRTLLGTLLPTPDGAAGELGGRVRLVDGSVLCRVGSTGTDFRLHLGYDLGTSTLTEVVLTGADTGEALALQTFRPQELVIADRGYGQPRSFATLQQTGAYGLVRINWQNFPLCHLDGTPVALLPLLRTLPYASHGCWAVQLPLPDTAPVPGRLLAQHLPEAEAQAARQRRARAARKRGTRLDPRTLEAAEYILLVTTAPATYTPTHLLTLYRFRWQVECVIKRLKSLLHLGALPGKDPALNQGWLYAKLLVACLLDRLAPPDPAFFP
ncbi:MAG: IS4 family transposase [Kiritimatiellia bacterium]